MSDRIDLWLEAAQYAASGRSFAFATVSRHRGSLPMATDAKMLITADGSRLGTVGGGCVEADVTAQALAALASGQPELVSHTLNADVAGDIGLSCGGTVQLFVEPVTPSEAFARLCRAVAAGMRHRERVAVCTALRANGGGVAKIALVGAAEHVAGSLDAWPQAEEVWSARSPSTYVDEERAVFVERIQRPIRVLIFGAGHVGAEIARLAAANGFHVVLVDDREEFANAERVPEAHEVIAEDFSRVLDRVLIDGDDFVLATTRGHSFDANIIERTAASPARYVGMLGSQRKKAIIWKALARAGVPQTALDRVHCPIGLDIGAESPAEIAVSVVAELIRARRFDEPL